MRVTTFVSAAAITLMASFGISAAAADQVGDASNEGFSTLRGVQVTPMNRTEMRAVKGAFNMFMNRNGSVVLLGSHGGNFQNTLGMNNVILGCGGGPQSTTFSAPSC